MLLFPKNFVTFRKIFLISSLGLFVYGIALSGLFNTLDSSFIVYYLIAFVPLSLFLYLDFLKKVDAQNKLWRVLTVILVVNALITIVRYGMVTFYLISSSLPLIFVPLVVVLYWVFFLIYVHNLRFRTPDNLK